jgi:hypothetical protein
MALGAPPVKLHRILQGGRKAPPHPLAVLVVSVPTAIQVPLAVWASRAAVVPPNVPSTENAQKPPAQETAEPVVEPFEMRT